MPNLSVSDCGNTIFIEDCDEQKTVVSDIGGIFDPVDGGWKVLFTIYNLNYLLTHLDGLTAQENLESFVEAQRQKEEKLSNLRTMSKSDIPVRFMIPGLKASLRNYQRFGVMYALTNGVGVLLADEMGLGKSLQAISVAVFLKSKGLAQHALIVTPASLKFNWPLEIEKFTKEKYVVIDGKEPEKRIAQWLRTDVFFYVVNYELVLEDLFGGKELKEPVKRKDESLLKYKDRVVKWEKRIEGQKKRERILGPVRRRKWDFIAIDEAQAIRNHTARRSQIIKRLRAKFKMALTGTPIDGKLEEMHSIMGFVAPGLLGSKTRFFQRHVETDFWGRITGYKRISEVTHRIAPFFIRRLKKDVLQELPDKIFQNIPVLLTDTERKLYTSLAEGGHEATEDAAAMTAIIRCKQFCNYPPLVDPSCRDTSKLEALKEILEEVITMNGNKCILFTQYKTMLDILVKVLDGLGMKYLRIDGGTPKKTRADMQAQFNGDKTIDIIAGTDAMATGLNLQGANYVINYDDFWSPSVMDQRSDRAHRMGQKEVVTVVNFVTQDTIEERIREVLFQKGKISAEVLGDETDELVLKRLGAQDLAKLL